MKVDKSRVNDPEYMKQEMKHSYKIFQFLGDDLRSNRSFILEMLKMEDFKFYYKLISSMGKDLKTDIDFIVTCAKILIDKGVLKADFISFLNCFPVDFLKNNTELLDAMRKAGIDIENSYTGKFFIDHTRTVDFEEEIQRKKDLILKNIENITVDEFLKITNSADRNNPTFMIDIIEKNEMLYACLSNSLKDDKEFMELAISRNPKIAEIAKAEIAKQEAIKEEKAKIKQEEKMERKINLEKQKELEQKEKEERIRQEYEEQGENHPKLILVNNFLSSNTSKKLFCKTNDIREQELDEALQEVGSIYPELKQKIEDKNRQTSAIYLSRVEKITTKLLSGEMTLAQYSRENNANIKISDLLRRIKNFEDRKNLQKIIINAIASGDLQMMDYVRLFSLEYDYKTVISSINSFIKETVKELPELQGKGKPINLAQMQVKELKKFEKLYKKSDFLGSSRGFKDNNGEIKMIQITDEHIEYARKYLKLEDEYICYRTMEQAISKLIKGEITKEEIDQMIEKRKAFLALKKKEQEKQELTQQAEKTDKEMKAAKVLKEEYEKKKPSTQDKNQNTQEGDLNNNGDTQQTTMNLVVEEMLDER